MTEIPNVTTERLTLRAWKPSDLEPYTVMNSDAETMRYMDGTFGAEHTERLVKHLMEMWPHRGFGMWALELRDSGEFVGRAGLYEDTGWPGVEVAWSVRRDLWNRGLATEAGAAAIRWGWKNLPVDHLITLPGTDNIASRRVAEKLGFRLETVGIEVGPWADQALYRLDRPSVGRNP